MDLQPPAYRQAGKQNNLRACHTLNRNLRMRLLDYLLSLPMTEPCCRKGIASPIESGFLPLNDDCIDYQEERGDTGTRGAGVPSFSLHPAERRHCEGGRMTTEAISCLNNILPKRTASLPISIPCKPILKGITELKSLLARLTDRFGQAAWIWGISPELSEGGFI